ncbi:MAG: M3 family metallopeptidase, partial [Mycobacterium leprae]
MSRPRTEVPLEETWRLEDVFPSAADYAAGLKAVADAIPAVTRFRGRLGESAAILLECLDALERLEELAQRVATYAQMQQSVDGTDPNSQAAYAQMAAVMARMETETAFVRSELVALPDQVLDGFMTAEPGLAPFQTLREEIRTFKQHALTAEGELVLAYFSELRSSPEQTYMMATTADMRFETVNSSTGEPVPVSLMGLFLHAEHSPDRELRRNAYASLWKGLAPYRNTLASALAAKIRSDVAESRLRGYDSVFTMLLQQPSTSGIMPDGVSVEVFDNVLDTIQTELAPHMQRLARLRQRVLGIERMELCDVKAPLDPDFNPAVSYDEAARMIADSVEVMGPEYSQIIRTALRDRWIDRADNIGRAGMAFCQPVYGVHSYVFSSFTGNLGSTFPLAHELGHAAHMEMAMRSQRITNFRFATFFVEAPSTLGEQLLADHLRRTSSDKRMHRLVNTLLLGSYHHDFITHLLEAELLRRLYRMAQNDEPLTEAIISREKGAILRRFWGDSVAVDESA